MTYWYFRFTDALIGVQGWSTLKSSSKMFPLQEAMTRESEAQGFDIVIHFFHEIEERDHEWYKVYRQKKQPILKSVK